MTPPPPLLRWPRLRTLCLVTVTLALIAGACSSGGTSGGDAGGDGDRMVVSDDGMLTLHVPDGVDATIAITPTDLTDTYGNEAAPFVPLAAYELGPDGATFAEPIQATFRIEDPALSELDPASIVVLSDSRTEGLEVLDASIDVADETAIVAVDLHHFSEVTAGLFFPLKVSDPVVSVNPPTWEMEVGDTWLPPLVIPRAGDPAFPLPEEWFEFQAITTQSPLVVVADEQVRCAEPGRGRLTVRGILRIPVNHVAPSLVSGVERSPGEPVTVTRPVDAEAAVTCLDSTGHAGGDDPVKVPTTDRRCVDSAGAEADGCLDFDILAGFRFARIAAPEDGPPLLPPGDEAVRASLNMTSAPLTDGRILGLACDGRGADFAPGAPGTMVPCRLSLLEDGLGTLLDPDTIDGIPNVELGSDDFVVDFGPGADTGITLFDRDGLVIPPGTPDPAGGFLPDGPVPIDSISFSLDNGNGLFSIATVDPATFTAATSGNVE